MVMIMDDKDELKKLLSDVSWDRKMCAVTNGSNLLVELYIKKAFDKKSAIEIPGEILKDNEVQQFVKDNRIKIMKGKKIRAYLYRLGKIVAAGEIALRIQERKNAAGSGTV